SGSSISRTGPPRPEAFLPGFRLRAPDGPLEACADAGLAAGQVAVTAPHALCNMLWIGPALGPVERACMRSVMRQGHHIVLWSYDPPRNIPEGVELRDAAAVVPPYRIIHHQNGSVSLFSNLFRYELQRQGRGTWLDCDVYLLKPLEEEEPYLLAEYEPGQIMSGVLRAPADSPLLLPLIALFDEKIVPPWLNSRARLAAHWRRLATGRTG